MGPHDADQGRDVGHGQLDVTIEPTGPQHRRVDPVREVRRGDDDDPVTRHGPVEEREPSVDDRGEPDLVVSVAAARADAVHLVDEQDEGP